MQTGDKKLVQIFKTFVEKNILPQLKKLEGSLAQWNKFSTLLLADNLNYGDLQHFVDSLPVWGPNSNDKFGLGVRKVDSEDRDAAFNASKTFGPEKNKLIYNMADDKSDTLDSRRQSQRDESLKQRLTQNNQSIFSNLEKLLKNLQENQGVLENLVPREPVTPTIQQARVAREPPQQYTSPPGANGFTAHSYNFIPAGHNMSVNVNGQNHANQSHSQPHSHSQSFSHVQAGGTYVKTYY